MRLGEEKYIPGTRGKAELLRPEMTGTLENLERPSRNYAACLRSPSQYDMWEDGLQSTHRTCDQRVGRSENESGDTL